MLSITKWHDWQAAPLTKIRGKRKENRVSASAPYAMPKVFIASALDGRFVEFADAVGPNAEGYFLRVLQYVALHDPFGGTVNVRREAFGPIVLTRAWDVVGKAKGCAVFDALLSTGIATAIQADQHPHGDLRRVSDGAPHGDTYGAPHGDASSSSGSSSGSNPPTPGGGSGAPAAQLASLSAKERAQIDAGCRAIHADPKAAQPLRTRAAVVFNGIREGSIAADEARAFYEREIVPKTNYRCAALAARGA